MLPVRDQGQGCNDEYAFNVGESIAGAKCVLTRDLKRLSEQQIIDCSQSFGNLGCQGGFYDQSMTMRELMLNLLKFKKIMT